MNIQDLKDLPHIDGKLFPTKPDDWDVVNQKLRIIAYELIEYCKSRSLPLVITSIIRPAIPGVSKTDIHSKGRAFDISVKGWTLDDCLLCEKFFNNTHQKIGAIGITDGIARACVYESPEYNGKGTGPHLHFQCRY